MHFHFFFFSNKCKHISENWFNYFYKVNPLKMVSTSFNVHGSILIHHLHFLYQSSKDMITNNFIFQVIKMLAYNK